MNKPLSAYREREQCGILEPKYDFHRSEIISAFKGLKEDDSKLYDKLVKKEITLELFWDLLLENKNKWFPIAKNQRGGK